MDRDQASDGRMLVLPHSNRLGTIAVVTCALASLIATTWLLGYLAITTFLSSTTYIRKLSMDDLAVSSMSRRRQSIKYRNQGYFWLLNLFAADFIQSIGWALSFDHLITNSILPSNLCNAQGFFINSGDIASALWSFVIAVHTFLLLAGGPKWRAWATEKSMTGKGRWVLMSFIWGFVVLVGVIGMAVIQNVQPQDGPFYNSAGAGWCWIGKNYRFERFFFHYIFVFIDAFALTILYVMLFVHIRYELRRFRQATYSDPTQESSDSPDSPSVPSVFPPSAFLQPISNTYDLEHNAGVPRSTNLRPVSPINNNSTASVTLTVGTHAVHAPKPKNKHRLSRQERNALREEETEGERARRRMMQVARNLLWYPLCYIVLTMPLSISRVAGFAGKSWPTSFFFVGASLYSSGGLVNVLLYTTTRRGIITWSWWFCCRARRSDDEQGQEIIRETIPEPPILLDNQPVSQRTVTFQPSQRDQEAEKSWESEYHAGLGSPIDIDSEKRYDFEGDSQRESDFGESSAEI